MRTSNYLLSTLREDPNDAELISHKLMLRAGMVRQIASGMYSWLPTGLRVLRKVEAIVRQEMDKVGANEILMPGVQPADLWEESGRWEQFGPELLRMKDRHNRDFCLGPTHEEVITAIVRDELNSYKQLPANFYQIQTKFRDERRPRFGVMRAREFLMKDAYSFHADQESMDKTYQDMHQAYCNIFERIGLDYRAVIADTGSIGGSMSHEFHVLADSGEDDIAFSSESDYAANVEKAQSLAPTATRPEPSQAMSKVETPNSKTIEAVANFLKIDSTTTIKTLLVKGSDEQQAVICLCLRGDHSLNELKAEKHPLIASPLEFIDDEELIKKLTNASPGSLGPVGLNMPVIVDRDAAIMADFVCGANEDDFHYLGVNWQRDAQISEVFDLRQVIDGDISPDGKGILEIKRGIEVGHIFQLGTKYSESMKATVLDQNGKAREMTMGCYGIGVSRIVAATIEQNYDEHGILWPTAVAPFQLAIIPMNMHKSEQVQEHANKLYQELSEAGIEVLFDDRKERPGVMFSDMELIGIPHRLVISERGIKNGTIEYKDRKGENKQDIALEQINQFVSSIL